MLQSSDRDGLPVRKVVMVVQRVEWVAWLQRGLCSRMSSLGSAVLEASCWPRVTKTLFWWVLCPSQHVYLPSSPTISEGTTKPHRVLTRQSLFPWCDAAETWDLSFHPCPTGMRGVLINYGLLLKRDSWQSSLQNPDHVRLSDDSYLQPKPKVFKKSPFIFMLGLKQ